MAIQAYVFVECSAAKPFTVTNALTKVAGVEVAHAVTGSYDVIAFVHADSVVALGDLVSQHIHPLPGVLRTTTNLVLKPLATHAAPESDRGSRA